MEINPVSKTITKGKVKEVNLVKMGIAKSIP
jgi:hypothetical protein